MIGLGTAATSAGFAILELTRTNLSAACRIVVRATVFQTIP